MRHRPERWTIVLVGYWNRMIFTPQWTAQRIFEVEGVELEIPLAPGIPVILRDNRTDLLVQPQRLTLRTRVYDKDGIDRMETLAAKILDALPETPVSAFGINFTFEEASPGEELLDFFSFGDESSISAADWDVQEKVLRRQLRQRRRRVHGRSRQRLRWDGNQLLRRSRQRLQRPDRQWRPGVHLYHGHKRSASGDGG